MAVNKTLYLRDEDAAVWDKARELSGDKLSSQIAGFLRAFVAEKDGAAEGFRRIVLTYRDQGKIPRSKAFHGRWLVSPDKPWDRREMSYDAPPDWYALALSLKNKVVVFNFSASQKDERGIYPWGNFMVFDSFEKAIGDPRVPEGLVAFAMENLGIEVEELDI